MTKELQAINQEHTISLWAERISACRNSNLSVAQWCKENEVCVQTYYRWQKRLFTMAQAQQESRFAEVITFRTAGNIEVTVRIAGAEADEYSGLREHPVRVVRATIPFCGSHPFRW